MGKSPANPAKERAFQLFTVSKGTLSCAEIQTRLAVEGFNVRRETIAVWKSRDGWAKNHQRAFEALSIVDLQRALMGPKIAGLSDEARIDVLAQASDDLLATASAIATKIRIRVDALRPSQIEVKHIGSLVESTGRLIGFCAALDAEIDRRRGDVAKTNPDALGALDGAVVLTPLQQSAVRLAERRRAAHVII